MILDFKKKNRSYSLYNGDQVCQPW